MDKNTEREAFEVWADQRKMEIHKVSGSDGIYYADGYGKAAWAAWQARAALPAAELSETVSDAEIDSLIAEHLVNTEWGIDDAVKFAYALRALLARSTVQPKEDDMWATMRKETARQIRNQAVAPAYAAWLDRQAAFGIEAHGGNEIWNAATMAALVDPVQPIAQTASDWNAAIEVAKVTVHRMADQPLEDIIASIDGHKRPAAQEAERPELTVWYGPMPESNGKSNFTAILLRKQGDKWENMTDGITIDRSEYPDRVRYEADRVRYLLGELKERPFILDYDATKHSGYVPQQEAEKPQIPAGVYYGFEADNFYDAKACAGMGEDFYRRWRDRNEEFPQSEEAAREQPADERNMADVGRALMEAVKTHANPGWHPMDCPSEIVGDLRSERDENAEHAALYRFLRERDNFPGDEGDGPSLWDQLCELECDEFDDFIRAAMQSSALAEKGGRNG